MRRDHVLQFVLEAAQTPDFQGVTAQAVADALSIWRNDAAVELNKLVAEGKLRRVGKKNVRFFPASEETADIRPEPAVQEEPPQAEEETGQYRAFSGLVGADGSLKYQLRVAMAAVAYPPNGLNMLITGSTGSGKSHFARTIWEYAKETKALCGAHAPIPFVEFNCAEYADNPQLLLSHLFGYKKGAFTGALEDKPGLVEQANGGILFLDEIHGLSSTGRVPPRRRQYASHLALYAHRRDNKAADRSARDVPAPYAGAHLHADALGPPDEGAAGAGGAFLRRGGRPHRPHAAHPEGRAQQHSGLFAAFQFGHSEESGAAVLCQGVPARERCGEPDGGDRGHVF